MDAHAHTQTQDMYLDCIRMYCIYVYMYICIYECMHICIYVYSHIICICVDCVFTLYVYIDTHMCGISRLKGAL